MPNHVDQDLRISGKTVDLQDFKSFASGNEGVLCHNHFIPYPEKFREMDRLAKQAHDAGNYTVKDGFNSGGYEWCCDNWGTKWGIYDAALIQETHNPNGRGLMIYNFQSAWSPTNKIIFAMSQKFPTLRFRLDYWESGMCFKGTYTVKGGQVITDCSSKYRGNRGG